MGVRIRMRFATVSLLLLSLGTLPISAWNCPEYSVDFRGNDFQCFKEVESWETCGELCLGDTKCTHWSWHHRNFPDPAQQLLCCLKESLDPENADMVNAVQDCGMVSGLKSCNDDDYWKKYI